MNSLDIIHYWHSANITPELRAILFLSAEEITFEKNQPLVLFKRHILKFIKGFEAHYCKIYENSPNILMAYGTHARDFFIEEFGIKF